MANHGSAIPAAAFIFKAVWCWSWRVRDTESAPITSPDGDVACEALNVYGRGFDTGPAAGSWILRGVPGGGGGGGGVQLRPCAPFQPLAEVHDGLAGLSQTQQPDPRGVPTGANWYAVQLGAPQQAPRQPTWLVIGAPILFRGIFVSPKHILSTSFFGKLTAEQFDPATREGKVSSKVAVRAAQMGDNFIPTRSCDIIDSSSALI